MSSHKATRRPKAKVTQKELQDALKRKSIKAMETVGQKMGFPFWVLNIPGAGNGPDGEKQLHDIVNLVQNFIGRDGSGKPLSASEIKPRASEVAKHLADECLEDLLFAQKVLFVITTALENQGCDADSSCALMIDSVVHPRLEGIAQRLRDAATQHASEVNAQ